MKKIISVNKCATCNKQILKEPTMEIFTIDSGVYRIFCLDCIKMGYQNLKEIEIPSKDQSDLMFSFKKFIDKHIKRRAES